MTRIGVMRERYSAEVELHPSIFSEAYTAWCARADLWAKQLGISPFIP